MSEASEFHTIALNLEQKKSYNIFFITNVILDAFCDEVAGVLNGDSHFISSLNRLL